LPGAAGRRAGCRAIPVKALKLEEEHSVSVNPREAFILELQDFLMEITQKDGVCGYESGIAAVIESAFSPFVDSARKDNLGNLIFFKRGKREDAPRVLLAAHMDEIGLIITRVEEGGFLRFTSLGGFDVRVLPGQEVTVYGSETVHGVVGFKPPHLIREEKKGKVVKMEELFIDTGLPEKELRDVVLPGAIAALKRDFITLQHRCRAGKAMDDRAGVAVLWQCIRELHNIHHEANVYLVATVQEEVGVRGAVVAAFGLSPDVGIAVDVCHGDIPGAQEHEVSSLGKGPAITSGPNIHPRIAERLLATASDYNLPYQKDFSPGPTGTDARAIQVSLEGIPTGLLSVPLRYMHTTVELVDMDDIKAAGRLLAYFVTGLDSDFMETLKCS